jgi:hypothetical protein
MLKSILVATFMITAFAIVTVGTVSMTSEPAFAKKIDKTKKKKKKEKVKDVGKKKGDRLFQNCLLVGGSIRKSSSGANIRCCKRNHCITCPTTVRGGCKERWKALKNIKNPGLSTGSSGTQIAPAKNKPKRKFPSKVRKWRNNSNGTVKN